MGIIGNITKNNIIGNITKNIKTNNSPIIDSSLKLYLTNRFTYDENNRISAWLDNTSYQNHLLQSVSTNKPIYSISGGRTSATFDGIDDYLTITDSSLAINNSYSVFIVAEELSTDNNFNAIASTRVTGESGFNYYRENNTNSKQYSSWFYDPTLPPPPWRTIKVDTIPINTKFVLGEIATIGSTRTFFINDDENIGTLPATVVPNPDGLFQLAIIDSFNFAGNFKIYEVLFYTRALNSSEIEFNKNYLINKHGI